MNLTVEQLMAQIIKFLETDQPNMAVLYMKKALELLKKEKAQRLLDRGLSFFARLAEAFAGVFNAVAEAVVPVIAAFTKLGEAFQSDFALAADNE